MSDREENAAPPGYPDRDSEGGYLTPAYERGGGNAERYSTAAHFDELADTIERVIIPKLLVHLGISGLPTRETLLAGHGIGPEIVESFTTLVMAGDNREAFRFVERLFEHSICFETVLLDLMVPAAHKMGDLWVCDQCNFVDVTLGMTRIQQILRQFRHRNRDTALHRKGNVLLLPVPGEQHTFGLRVMEELLIGDGFDVTCHLKAGLDDILQLVSQKPFDIVGLSLSNKKLVEPLNSLIALIRHHSMNKLIHVIVGGSMFGNNTEIVATIDSEIVSGDAKELLERFNALSPISYVPV
jgi:methanogenic corrinoid protein MtbC1